jgi:hypothetical protein
MAMVKQIDRIKEHFKHRSLYRMTLPELEKLQKKQIENYWTFAINSIIAGVFGVFFFYYELQHTAIILFVTSSLLMTASLFMNHLVDGIDQAIFLLEAIERK